MIIIVPNTHFHYNLNINHDFTKTLLKHFAVYLTFCCSFMFWGKDYKCLQIIH